MSASAVSAQSPGNGPDPQGIVRKEAVATRIPNNSIVVDGLLGESEWGLGVPAREFVQREPFEGQAATEETEVFLLYDDDALYVGARMYSANSMNVMGGATRRDDLGFSEAFKICLDGYLDRKTSYSFGVTAAGVRRDHYYPIDDEIKSRDAGFDPVWEVKTSIDSVSWIAEMRIPFSQLRFYDSPEQVWGLNFNRYIPSRNEDVYWVPRSKKEPGWASRFGNLRGITGITSPARIEIMPYAAASVSRQDREDPLDPFDDGFQSTTRLGADIKVGAGPHLTLDLTVNPDFGQVEADPAVINLTAFETIFPERRPFFVEGNKLLSNSFQPFFYSRRIGAPPHGTVAAAYSETPANTTILAASKLSGRLSSGLSVGVLAALTSSERSRIVDPVTAAVSTPVVEPMTGYAVMRLEQEFGPAGSMVGITGTATRREASPLRTTLADLALTGGMNWNIRFDRGTYEFTGEVGGSVVSGSASALQKIQASSAHYFQRPDSRIARFDSTATRLSGYAVNVGFNKYGGDHWLWGATFLMESPGLELNDVGRLASADDIEFAPNVHFRETVPSDWYHSYDIGLSLENGWNFGGIRQFQVLSLTSRFTWKNFVRTDIGVSHSGRALSDNQTRGGPLMATPEGWSWKAMVANGVTSRTRLSASTEHAWDALGGWSTTYGFSIEPRPGDEWQFSVEPGFEKSLNKRQYVSSLASPGKPTYGRRYIFAAAARTTMYVRFHLTYNFSPFLSLEAYGEPFAARARYTDFGELAYPGGMDVRLYGSDLGTVTREEDGSLTIAEGGDQFNLAGRDFNIRSFRSNLVLRWEWRAGSTLYLVWQQNRMRSDGRGDDLTARSVLDAFTADGENIVALKLSYWISAN